MKKILLVLVLLLFVRTNYAQSSANENSSDITTYYLVRHAEKDTNDRTNKNPELTNQISQSMLNTLIEQKVMLLKAKDDTIKVADEEIDSYLQNQMDYMIQQAGSKEKLVEYYGMPMVQIKKHFRKDTENQMTIQRLKQQKIATIKQSRKEIENFYTTYKDSLPDMEATVDISHILLTPQPIYPKELKFIQMTI